MTSPVMLFDIDHFKQVNDRNRHSAGDRVLSEIAGRAQRQVRSVDLVGRIGGEELVVVMPETNPSGAADVERIRAAIAAVTGEDADHRAERLLKRADDALYAAKNGGRNRVVARQRR